MEPGIKSLHSMSKPVSCKSRTSNSNSRVIRIDSCTFLPIFNCVSPKIQLICSDFSNFFKLIILLFFSFQVEHLAITFHPGNESHQQKDSTKSFNENSFSSF